MPGPRLMIDSILMPDGNVLLINGAATGVSTLSTFSIHHSPLITLLHISWQRLMLFPIKSAHRMPITQVKPPPRTFVEHTFEFILLFQTVLTPWLYTVGAPKGQRFTTGFAESEIPRMYHSTASLLPDGSVLV